MKKKITIGFIGIAFIAAFGFSWNFATVCLFVAVYHDGTGEHNLIEAEIKEDDIKLLHIVLDQYEEDFRVKGDKIYITPRLYFNEQLRWNYSSKAGIQKSHPVGAGNG
ncbi:hypothetical protein [Cerasicoccus fimbriatus]|uniref:hypothetical protein n=1 Tax=Cerasicoccus fimbriatus TaxID=3014554 RepID=UPI0022B33CA4|nr:hypothetical protein [Cerasicoccus sp. TK19100]